MSHSIMQYTSKRKKTGKLCIGHFPTKEMGKGNGQSHTTQIKNMRTIRRRQMLYSVNITGNRI